MVACHEHIDFGWNRGAWNAFLEILPQPLSPIVVNKYSCGQKKNSCGYGISYHPCLIVQRMNKTKRGACQNLGIGILRKSWIITIRKFILHKHYIFQILKYRIFCRYPIFVNLGKNQRYFYTHEGSQKNKTNNYYKPRSVVGPDNNFPNFSSLEFS